ncbi:MAG: hypothetical protein HC830_14445 [Bacteroidetes bacterium]|nr:hypothetical protein [Bacteroidota bacterium]
MNRNQTFTAMIIAAGRKYLTTGLFICTVLLPGISVHAQDAETLATRYLESIKII